MPTPLSLPPSLLIFCSLIPVSVLAVALVRVWREQLSDEERLYSAVLLLLAVVALWPSVYHASNVLISDAVEYGIGAYRMFTSGSYDISLDGRSVPPRYPIGFSLFVLMPGFWLASEPSIGAGVYSVALLAALGTPCAFLLGYRLHSVTAGFLAAGGYLVCPGMWPSSQEVVTNAPAAALWLVPLAVFTVRDQEKPLAWSSALAIGLAVMLAAACRPLAGLIVIPLAGLLLLRREKLTVIIGMLIPVTILATIYLAYNIAVFGAPFRSGYNFWCAIPYDVTSLVFNARFLTRNLPEIWNSGFPIVALFAVVGLSAMRFTRLHKDVLLIAFSSSLMLAVIHLVYFFPMKLFFLPSAAVLMPWVGVAIAAWIEKAGLNISRLTGVLTVSLVCLLVRFLVQNVSHSKNPQIDFIKRAESIVTKGSVLVSGINPALLEGTLGRTRGIQVVPISRKVEFASKVMVPKKLPEPEITINDDVDCPRDGLPMGTYLEPFSQVATDSPEIIDRALASGKSVYLETLFATPEDVALIQERYLSRPLQPGLMELSRSGLKISN